jgi:hypothetical protein
MVWKTEYESHNGTVFLQGKSSQPSDDFDNFLRGPVADRFMDEVGSKALVDHLGGLSLTGMGKDALEEVLAAAVMETRDWAAGEALAEAVLETNHNVVLPWNNERDKRNPFASLPGADIVGFYRDETSYCLCLGEVKCSTEPKSPPQVMSGRSGMVNQIDTLANDLGMICQLLQWLLPRVKKTEFEEIFNIACTRYFNSGNRDVMLFGILIRDQLPNQNDLQRRGNFLAKNMNQPTRCQLIALYLPLPIAELPKIILQGNSA